MASNQEEKKILTECVLALSRTHTVLKDLKKVLLRNEELQLSNESLRGMVDAAELGVGYAMPFLKRIAANPPPQSPLPKGAIKSTKYALAE